MKLWKFVNIGKTGNILVLSLSIALVFAIGAYCIVKKVVQAGLINITNLLIFLLILTGVLLASVLILAGMLNEKYLKEHSFASELKDFKSYLDSLYSASSEVEIYEVMCTFIGRMPYVDKAAVFYRSDILSEGAIWQQVPSAETSICSTSLENCSMAPSRQELSSRNSKGYIAYCSNILPEYKPGCAVCFPVVHADQIQSIVQVYTANEYSFDCTTLFTIESYIEVARPVINSKKTMYILNKKATTDRLTKLYNRNFLDPYLENQIEAANLSNQHISAIMVDLDHFKLVNDTYGHLMGDHILKAFAQLMLKCIRKTDLVARYGGDEFIVILPSTNIKTAEAIAERIRHEVAEAHIPFYDGIEPPSISCSVGVSTYPIFCSSKDALIKTSDIALLEAKQAGRNCMKTYQKEAFTTIS